MNCGLIRLPAHSRCKISHWKEWIFGRIRYRGRFCSHASVAKCVKSCIYKSPLSIAFAASCSVSHSDAWSSTKPKLVIAQASTPILCSFSHWAHSCIGNHWPCAVHPVLKTFQAKTFQKTAQLSGNKCEKRCSLQNRFEENVICHPCQPRMWQWLKFQKLMGITCANGQLIIGTKDSTRLQYPLLGPSG